MTIATELSALRSSDGLLRVEVVEEWARDNPGSALHASLEWDDATAAYNFRLWQVRRLIAIHIVDEDRNRQEISLRIDRTARGGGYRNLDDVMEDVDLRAEALRDALSEYERIRNRYEWLRELAEVHESLDRVPRPPPRQRRRRQDDDQPRPNA